MKRLLVCVVLLFAVLGSCFAQVDAEKEKALADFRLKIHQLEMYNMILPVVMTKPEIRAILTVVEKCRDRSRQLMENSYKLMMQLQPTVDDALAKADKDSVPSPSVIDKLEAANVAETVTDQMTAAQNEDDIYAAVTKNLNAGQLKAMANSLNPKEFKEWLKNPDQVSQEDKIRIFIKAVFMDYTAYDLLRKMSL